MTHPPPDPEGRQASEDESNTRLATIRQRMEAYTAAREAARECSVFDPAWPALYDRHRATEAEVGAWACGDLRFLLEQVDSLAARLDAALATKDEREAVERLRALVRELRGEG